MVRPLSNDLRKRVVAAVSKGESCRAVALRFGVSVSSAVKWSQRYRSTGSVAPGKMGGHRKPVLDRCSLLNRAVPMSPAGAAAGDHGRPASIRDAWSLSMRHGSRPTWFRCVAGRPRVLDCAASRRMATGAR
jgi:hypothetical protein